jgi:hypothetical protein
MLELPSPTYFGERAALLETKSEEGSGIITPLPKANFTSNSRLHTEPGISGRSLDR